MPTRGVKVIYAPDINSETVLHFSWKDESCALRDYSKRSTHEPSPNRNFTTSYVESNIKQEVWISNRPPLTNVEFWHNKILELNNGIDLGKTIQEREYKILELNNGIDLGKTIPECEDKTFFHSKCKAFFDIVLAIMSIVMLVMLVVIIPIAMVFAGIGKIGKVLCIRYK